MRDVVVICLPTKNVLLLQTVTLAQRLEHIVPDVHVGIVLIRICAPLLYRVLDLEDRRRIAVLGIKNGMCDLAFRVGNILYACKQAVKNLFLAAHCSFLLKNQCNTIARRDGCK